MDLMHLIMEESYKSFNKKTTMHSKFNMDKVREWMHICAD
jgi:hypothetical protein